MNPTPSAPDAIIGHWMEISRLLRKKLSNQKKVSTINPMQVHALLIIKEHDGLTMKEFASYLHVTSPSATSFVNRLVKLKWVKRAADASNRKLVRLKLSEQGAKIVGTEMKQHTKIMHDLFSLLSLSDQKELARILLNLRETLAKESKKP